MPTRQDGVENRDKAYYGFQHSGVSHFASKLLNTTQKIKKEKWLFLSLR